MEHTIRLGLLGCGNFGRNHYNEAKTVAGIQIIAAYDPHPEKYCIFDGDPTVTLYDDYKEILQREDIDGVIVASADQAHAKLTVDALRAGKHVLCEKPMALALEDCSSMISAADQNGKVLMVGQVCRLTPSFVQAKQLVDAGAIGELFFVESEYAHDYSRIGGTDSWRIHPDRHPMLGGACHAIDLLRWIAGDPLETMAYSNHKVLTSWPVDDCTISIFQFPSHVIGKVFCSIGCKRDYTMRTVLYGTKGTIIADNTSPELTLYQEELAPGMNTQTVPLKLPVTLNNHNIAGEHVAFRDAIAKGIPVPTDGREGAKTVAVCLAAVQASQVGRPVAVDYSSFQ